MVTGATGFIAYHVCTQLLDQGDQVVGVDNLNDYYDIRLKEWRLEKLNEHPSTQNFFFEKLDIENRESVQKLFSGYGSFDAVLNLAAWGWGSLQHGKPLCLSLNQRGGYFKPS